MASNVIYPRTLAGLHIEQIEEENEERKARNAKRKENPKGKEVAIATCDDIIAKKEALVAYLRKLVALDESESVPKFAVGDKVKVVPLRTLSMHHKGYEEFLGETVTIRKAYSRGIDGKPYYYIEERIDWTWTEDMFE